MQFYIQLRVTTNLCYILRLIKPVLKMPFLDIFFADTRTTSTRSAALTAIAAALVFN